MLPDNDGSGTIDSSELKKMVRELMPELKLDPASWDDLVKSVSAAGDKDGNGECGWCRSEAPGILPHHHSQQQYH